MISELKLKHLLGLLLQIGIILSILLVLVGGISFLLQHGGESYQNNVILSTNYDIDIIKIWHNHHFNSPIGFIELGLLTLVIMQVLRVVLLALYYILIRDYWFISFNIFILSIILFSLIRQ